VICNRDVGISTTTKIEVSYNGGTPKWMVYNGKSQIKMDEN
jgi:hypothetical protein